MMHFMKWNTHDDRTVRSMQNDGTFYELLYHHMRSIVHYIVWRCVCILSLLGDSLMDI